MQSSAYAKAMKTAMKQRTVTIRELARRLDYSYEHVRKVVRGEPVVSPEMNEKICKALHLNQAQMWAIAEREKAVRKIDQIPLEHRPIPTELAQSWGRLTGDQQQKILALVRGWLVENEL
jgi:transcriptional regulator with XRE-family HTH domain